MPERLQLELWSVPVCSKAEIIDKVGWQSHRRESTESMAHRKTAHREVFLEERKSCVRINAWFSAGCQICVTSRKWLNFQQQKKISAMY